MHTGFQHISKRDHINAQHRSAQTFAFPTETFATRPGEGCGDTTEMNMQNPAFTVWTPAMDCLCAHEAAHVYAK